MDRIAVSIGPATGSAPTQPLTVFSNAAVKDSLTGGPECSWSMPADCPAALLTDGLATDAWVYRNGTLWHRLRILPVDQEWGENGEDEVAITAVGYRRLVEARHIISGPPVFYATEQGTIIWNLIQHTQAQTGGDLGITQGTTTTGQVRDRTEYKIGDELGKIINALGDVINGCWWGIDSGKVLTVKLWSAFTTRTNPLVRGANARKLKRVRGRQFANVAGSVGSIMQTVPYWAADASVSTDPRGRWEYFDTSHPDVILQPQVVEYAAGELAARLHPPSHWTVQVDATAYFEGGSDFNVGEFVPIIVPVSAVDEIGLPAVSVVAQITEVNIGFDENGALTVTMAGTEVS